MTIYRNPVVGSPIGSQRLHCIGDACAAKFNHHPTGSEMFVCPNRGFSEGKCSSAAFVYPRKRKSVPTAKSRDGDGIFKHFHQGIDLARVRGKEAAGDPIYSVTAGTVVHVDREDDAGYGFIIIVKSEVPWQSDPLYFAYAHCGSIPERWRVGSSVSERDVVGTVGSTGNPGPDGPHLHFEVRVSSHMPKEHEWKSESTQTELLLRIDPLEVLERLGPWGMSKVYFPIAQKLKEGGFVPAMRAQGSVLHSRVESSRRGGYFPLGANNDWHGGVHLETTAAQTLIAPFDAKIVALRLDPDPTSSLAAAGHVNFILLKHEISEPAAKLLENKPIAVDPKAKPKPPSVGRGGTNEPDLVLQAKSGLHTRMSPSTGAPFYDPANVRELVDPYPDDELYASIEAFQASIKPPKPPKKKKKKNAAPAWPDGLMTVDGYTWRSLFGSSPKVPMHKDGAPEGGDPHAVEPTPPDGADPSAREPVAPEGGDPHAHEPARPDGGDPSTREPTDPGASDKPKPTPDPEEKEDPKRTIFALLMHLGPLSIDETTTARFSWLGRATATPRSDDEAENAAAKAKQARAEDRAEAKYTLKGCDRQRRRRAASGRCDADALDDTTGLVRKRPAHASHDGPAARGARAMACLLASMLMAACGRASDGGGDLPAAAPPTTAVIALDLPIGVEVTLDGEVKGTTPLATVTTTPGSHRLRLAWPCGEVELPALQLAAGETKGIDVTVSPGLGRATYTPKARGLDGKPLDVRVKLGEHVIDHVGHGQTLDVVACPMRVTLAHEGLGAFIEDVPFGPTDVVVREVVLAPGTDMVRIEGGDFVMGMTEAEHRWFTSHDWGPSDGEQLGETDFGAPALPDGAPRIEVKIATFDIDRHEVTAAQFVACRDAAAGARCDSLESCRAVVGCPLPARRSDDPDEHEGPYCTVAADGSRPGQLTVTDRNSQAPANCIPAWKAAAYCRWVGKRLPTEAEWEFAARSRRVDFDVPWGARTPGDWEQPECERTGCVGHASVPASVCSHSAGDTSQGLCDMMGNVEEFVTRVAAARRAAGDIVHTTKGAARAWGNQYIWRAWAYREKREPAGFGLATHGFRCARDVEVGAP